MHPPGADVVLLRYGDASVKSPTVKRFMLGQLVENVEALLADRGVAGELERGWHRPLIHTDAVDAAARAATDAFGVVSASPALAVAPELETVETALARTAAAVYDGGSFAVDASRADKRLPFTSEDVEREGGRAIWEAVADGFEPTVDLEAPDHRFGVELREEVAYVFTERLEGPGGLPLGSQAPMVALISGGIDSPVAAYETMRRGSPVVPVYVDLGEYGGVDHEARAMATVRSLSRYAPNYDVRPYRVPGGETVGHLVETMEGGRMLSVRRFFLAVAERIAEEVDAAGIVTGEALGQKSSQTGRNLAVTGRMTALPVHRPLLNYDKGEITERAREIGTFEESTIPAGCNRLAPDRPETNGRIEALSAVEPDDLRERAVAAAEAAERVEL